MKLLLLLLALSPVFAYAQKEKPVPISTQPVDQERLAIYQTFLASHFGKDSKAGLNISQTTSPFRPGDYDAKGCLAGFQPDDLKVSAVHSFGADAFPGQHLVDPAKHKARDPEDAIKHGQTVDKAVEEGFVHALFSFSEIVFDASHTHAAFSYSLYCGRLCGNGGTVVYELTNGKWQSSSRSCGFWIS